MRAEAVARLKAMYAEHVASAPGTQCLSDCLMYIQHGTAEVCMGADIEDRVSKLLYNQTLQAIKNNRQRLGLPRGRAWVPTLARSRAVAVMRRSMMEFEILTSTYIERLGNTASPSEITDFVNMLLAEEQRVYAFALLVVEKYARQCCMTTTWSDVC